MKKITAVLLVVLMAFSMFSMAASAASVDVIFIDRDGTILKQITIDENQELTYEDFPIVKEQFEIETRNPLTGELEIYRYTLRGWESSADGNIYYPGSFVLDRTKKTVAFSAVYLEEDLSTRQSFWELVESIFERINLIFEYFATIFNF